MFEEEKQVAVLLSSESSDLTRIKTLAKTVFSALSEEDTANVTVQGFDRDFEEWVDLRESFTAQHKEKLRIGRRNFHKEPAKVSNM